MTPPTRSATLHNVAGLPNKDTHRHSLAAGLSFVLLSLTPALWCPSVAVAASHLPGVFISDAPLVEFRGANSPSVSQPGDTDCNSPAHWDGATLYLFHSAGHPWRCAGSDLLHLTQSYVRCEYDNQFKGGRWIESTWRTDDGLLYGWYHHEPVGLCPGKTLTAPRIGAARSTDNGAHWHDLGVIIEAPPGPLRCDTANFYFAGGTGDFTVLPDVRRENIYFFISTYGPGLQEQGIAVARLAFPDRDHPVGKVRKWHAGAWSEPGLGGHVTPIFPVAVDWHQPKTDAFWGPSIHWNSYLRQNVLLLNRAQDSHWTQEGIYVSFNPDLAQPGGWSAPRKILDSQGKDRWYPQVLGIDPSQHETDKLAGQTARLFLRGQSRWLIHFSRP